MYPWRRVLIPTDFSTAARWAFDNAIHIAGSTGAELDVLHIRMTLASRPDKLRFPADEVIYNYAEEYELEALRRRARDLNASVVTRLLVRQAPDPGAEIHRAAGDEAVDLTVISTHARHHVAHLLIGSTTMSVLSDPPAPVLAIRYGTRRRRHMRKLVVPVHPRQASMDAPRLAAAIAAHEDGELHLIVVSDGASRETAAACTSAVASHLTNIRSEQVIVEGENIEREIVRYAHRIDADAILVHTAMSDLKLAIIRSAETPVMIVPG